MSDPFGDILPEDDPNPPSPGDVAGKNIKALTNKLPPLFEMLRGQVPQNALAKLIAAQGVESGYGDIARSEAEKNAQTAAGIDKGLLGGTGADVTRLARALQGEVDPEFFSTREAAGKTIQDMLANPLTGGELSSIERGLNRQNAAGGNLGGGANTQTISNAITYGGAARDRLSQALNAATSFLPVSRSGIDAFSTATKSAASNPNAFNTGAIKAGVGDETYGTSTAIQGSLAPQNTTAIEAAQGRQTGAQKFMSSMPDY